MKDVDGPEAVQRRRLRGKPYQSLLRAPPDVRGALAEAPIMQISHRMNERLEEEQIGKSSQDFALQLHTSKSTVSASGSSTGSMARPSTVAGTTGRQVVGGFSDDNSVVQQRQNREQRARSAELALPSPHRAGPPVFRPMDQEIFRDMWSTLESTRPQQFWMPYREEQEQRARTRQGTVRGQTAPFGARRPRPVVTPVSLEAGDASSSSSSSSSSLSRKNEDFKALLGGSSTIFRSMQAYGRNAPNVLARARDQRIAAATCSTQRRATRKLTLCP